MPATLLPKSVAVIGAGGNIGSHLAPHLGRMPGVERVTLVDFDRYESKNLATQDILPRDVGRPKVAVQARRLRQINPQLDVRAIAERVERVPLGLLRAAVIVACVDSRSARQAVNQIAWRLGAAWIDAGVAAGGELLTRVNVYLPGLEAPCLECAWDERDYALLEVRHPCQSEAMIASTNAPSMLGSLAASLAAIECRKLLDGDREHALAGRQVVIDARHHAYFVTSFRRNPLCRFDHRTWGIRAAGIEPKKLRLKDLAAHVANGISRSDHSNEGVAGGERSEPPAERANSSQPRGPDSLEANDSLETNEGESRTRHKEFRAGSADANGRLTIQLEGDRFLLRPFCPNGCTLESKRSPEIVGLASRLSQARCPKCEGRLVPRGWDMADQLDLDTLQTFTGRRTLASLGFRSHDVITLTQGGRDFHIELA